MRNKQDRLTLSLNYKKEIKKKITKVLTVVASQLRIPKFIRSFPPWISFSENR